MRPDSARSADELPFLSPSPSPKAALLIKWRCERRVGWPLFTQRNAALARSRNRSARRSYPCRFSYQIVASGRWSTRTGSSVDGATANIVTGMVSQPFGGQIQRTRPRSQSACRCQLRLSSSTPIWRSPVRSIRQPGSTRAAFGDRSSWLARPRFRGDLMPVPAGQNADRSNPQSSWWQATNRQPLRQSSALHAALGQASWARTALSEADREWR
jgi:hypothetical protein